MSKLLVTGAAGFIGCNLVRKLLNDGHDVVALDNFNAYYDPTLKRANIAPLLDHPRLTFYEMDICDAQSIDEMVVEHRPAAIAHLAAYGGVRYSIGRASLYTHVNITGSVNVLEAARKAQVPNFVFASTSSVYGNTEQLPFIETDPCNEPLAPYPASKKAIEVMGYCYHNLHAMNFTAVRFFSVYGPHGRPDMMPFMVMDHIVKGQPITLFDGGQMKRDWTYVDDIVAGITAALHTQAGYQVINLGRGEPVLMADFVAIIEKLVGKKAKLLTPPAPASEPKVTFANIDKARRLLNYAPQTPVAQGLEKMWQWYQACMMAR
jgi:UDP-glucuronate 4-epimerase